MYDAKDSILGNMAQGVAMLQACPEFSALVPEVRVNLAYALPGASSPQEVAAVDGRITVVHGFPHASGIPAWGASDHLARRILEVRKYDAGINAAMNFKYDPEIIKVVQQYCAEKNLLFGFLDRSREPDEVSTQDGVSMPWKVKQLFTINGGIPRMFYEGAGWGKEPLFLALGKDAVEAASMGIDIARLYKNNLW